MAKSVAQTVDFGRGAFPAIGRKVGLIQNTLDLAGTASGDGITAITFKAPALVIAAGVEVVEPWEMRKMGFNMLTHKRAMPLLGRSWLVLLRLRC